MNINRYKILISNLPVRCQSFTTKLSTWEKAEKAIPWLENSNGRLFNSNESLSISRQDIFETIEIREVILKTIYWGYPGDMRGNHFVNILKNIELLEEHLGKLKSNNNLISKDFEEIKNIFKDIEGLGLSTYSKLLYFLGIKFNDNPCLILDQRLIDVFTNKIYNEFTSLSDLNGYNKEKKYLEFLSLMNETSIKLNTKGENIEQFLFIFGNNLKTDKNL